MYVTSTCLSLWQILRADVHADNLGHHSLSLDADAQSQASRVGQLYLAVVIFFPASRPMSWEVDAFLVEIC